MRTNLLRSQRGNLTVLCYLIQLKCPEREEEKLAVHLLAEPQYLRSAGRLTVRNSLFSTVLKSARLCSLCMNKEKIKPQITLYQIREDEKKIN